MGFVDELKEKKPTESNRWEVDPKQTLWKLSGAIVQVVWKVLQSDKVCLETHVAQVCLQLSDTFVLWCIQDHREVGKVLLCLHWVGHLEMWEKERIVMPSKYVVWNENKESDIKDYSVLTLCLVMLRTWTISGVSYRKQPRPLSHVRSSLYFS